MKYKRNLAEVLQRLDDFYALRGTDRIYAKMNIPVPALDRYQAETTGGLVEYPDMHRRIAFWDECLSVHTDSEDDSVPSAYPTELDQGLYAALVGAKDVRFLNDPSWGWVSSMTTPFVDDLRTVRSFRLDPDNRWFRLYEEQLRIFAKGAEGKFGISHFTLINGMNFLAEVRGATNAYMDLVDDPEEVQAVFDFAEKLNAWIHGRFFEIVGLTAGGTCSNLGQWLPGRSLGESVDPFHLTSPETFEAWGRAPVEKIFARFDSGIVHLHSNGHHLLESVTSLKGLKLIVFGDEPFNPPVYLKLASLAARRGTMPIWLAIPCEAFAQALARHELPANVFYNVTGVPDLATGNELMREVKRYRG